MKNVSREFKLAIFCLVIFGVAGAGIFYGYDWFMMKQVRVANGVARPVFPYNDYDRDELEAMYPQVANENVVTTRTPEQTHQMFVEKLKAGDLNGAVECCVAKGEWEEIKEGLQKVKTKGELGNMVRDLDVAIKRGQNVNVNSTSIATLYYTNKISGVNLGSTIDFEKNRDGVWLITSF